jgi:hypothetical protein
MISNTNKGKYNYDDAARNSGFLDKDFRDTPRVK